MPMNTKNSLSTTMIRHLMRRRLERYTGGNENENNNYKRLYAAAAAPAAAVAAAPCRD
jgi:hypothetical protein